MRFYYKWLHWLSKSNWMHRIAIYGSKCIGKWVKPSTAKFSLLCTAKIRIKKQSIIRPQIYFCTKMSQILEVSRQDAAYRGKFLMGSWNKQSSNAPATSYAIKENSKSKNQKLWKESQPSIPERKPAVIQSLVQFDRAREQGRTEGQTTYP